jgi:hypothetical protein
MTPDEIRDRGLYPVGFRPLPHENHPEGGMVFPPFQISEVKKQTGRDLARLTSISTCQTGSCPSSPLRST